MTIRQEYQKFLNDNFPGLKVRTPLFFNWPYALRFDLQEGETDNNAYFEEVFKRSAKLFDALFAPDDEMFFLLIDHKYKRSKIRNSNFCFKQIADLHMNEVNYYKAHRLYEPDDKFDIKNIAVIKLFTRRLNFENILKAIGNTDFPPRKPRLDEKGVFCSKEIYFLNMNKKLIFHMYDDRGLDIIANDIETIRPLYEQYNSWILACNRGQIDSIFNNKVL